MSLPDSGLDGDPSFMGTGLPDYVHKGYTESYPLFTTFTRLSP
jgi:hypothetical protein